MAKNITGNILAGVIGVTFGGALAISMIMQGACVKNALAQKRNERKQAKQEMCAEIDFKLASYPNYRDISMKDMYRQTCRDVMIKNSETFKYPSRSNEFYGAVHDVQDAEERLGRICQDACEIRSYVDSIAKAEPKYATFNHRIIERALRQRGIIRGN